MKAKFSKTIATLAAAAVLASPLAQATNGYFKIGYGAKNRGVAGAGVAWSQDSLAPAVNPAGISSLRNRVDAGIELFNPRRDAGIDGTGLAAPAPNDDPPVGFGFPPGGLNTGKVKSGATVFAIPNAGFIHEMDGPWTLGFAMIANGGMNTRYNTFSLGGPPGNIYSNAFSSAIGATDAVAFGAYGAADGWGFAEALEDFCSVGAGDCNNFGEIDASLGNLGNDTSVGSTMGVNLAQLIMAPTFSYQLNENHAVGISPLLGYQTFRAYGLGLFKGFSTDNTAVTNNGDDDSWGMGVKLGWQGQVANGLTLGASAQSKIYMQEFDKYKGLFAEQGAFDIPATYTVGAAFTPNNQWTFALDVQRILYSGVASISNPGPTGDDLLLGFMRALHAGNDGVCASANWGGALGGTCLGANALGNDQGFGFGWDDITVVKVGANYVHNDRWTFRGGLNVGENPIADDQNLFNVIAPGIVERHLTLGFTYTPNRTNEFTVSAMHAFREDQQFKFTNGKKYGGALAAFGMQEYDVDLGMDQYSLEFSYAWKFD